MTTPPVVPLANPRLARVRVALVICVASLAALVAAIAYLVSFEAISAYVFTIGTAFLLWLALSGAHLASEHDAWFAWLLIATATVASAYLNAAHAPDRWDARLGAGSVPVALLASVHLLVRLMVRLLTLQTSSATSATAPAAASAPDQRGNATNARAISPRQSRRAIGATRPVFERLAAAGQPVSWRQFAAAFDPPMPRRTAQRHLAHHQAAAPSANGQQPIADPEEVTR